MCVSVFHQIYVGCLLCDWPRDISGHPPRLPSSLSCQKVNQQNKALKIYPSTPHRPGGKGPAGTRCACLCAVFLSLLQSLLLSLLRWWICGDQSFLMAQRGVASITLFLCLLPSPLLLSGTIQPKYHKLSVKLTSPSTISQGSCVAHRTLLHLICSHRHRPATCVCVSVCVF